jgi:Zn-finger nucleic acid-binding protein
MNRTNFAKRSGILIDTCRGHGTWFDADELPRVVDFVMNGGIEAATEANLRQKKSDARLAESKARAARSQSSVMMTPVGRHGFGGRDNLTVSAFGGLLGIIGSVLD